MARSDWVKLFEGGMSPDDIADLFEIDVGVVRAQLGTDVVREVEVEKGKALLAQHGLGDAMPEFFEGVREFSPAAYDTFLSLRKGEMVEGLPIDDIGRRRLGMMMEKVAGGMRWDSAAYEVGLSVDYVRALADKHAGLDAWLMECKHSFQMRAMAAVGKSLDRGDGKLGLEMLSRTTDDFKPATKSISVSGGDVFRQAWQVIDAEAIVDNRED